ncbi:MAG TPA: cytochrome c oxidase assembly protein [Alphaproteobacteria bacterium]|nr:cytochrome c oxidase assembly protein [Alphaproteobacteria bacterium]
MARARRKLTVVSLVATIAVMTGLVAGAVPLYRLFCQVTGFGGTPQVAEAAPGEVAEDAAQRIVTVRFDSNVAADLPWRFEPVARAMEVKVGEVASAYYRVTNLADSARLGSATFNVTPDKVGVYFDKIECFCFSEQYLAAGESAELAVTFFVDPEIAADRHLDDLTTITLSYTFFDQGEEALKAYLARTEGERVAEGGGAPALN